MHAIYFIKPQWKSPHRPVDTWTTPTCICIYIDFFSFVPFSACEIPFETILVNRFSGAKRQKVQSTRSFLYVPILQTLEQLLKNEEILTEVQSKQYIDDSLVDYLHHGSIFKDHPVFSTYANALQIIAYYDELEVTNPIGLYVNTHKLGCSFFTLGNIHPKYRSSFKAIFLVAVARTADIDRYGIDPFLRPFVNDLKILYLDGITLNASHSHPVVYFGALTAFLADTVAAHKLGGFKGSVSFANRICRSCMATKNSAQSFFDESHFELRTPELHEVQCQSLEGREYREISINFSINRLSVLEEVPGFSVAVGLPHDIMHDIFEGVLHYELKLFLHYCKAKGFFTFSLLNSRIRGYDFGSDDKPSLIDPTSLELLEKKFRQSASQSIAIARNLPLLIANKIPENDENWCSILVLLKICQICLSPVNTVDTAPHLRVLIEEKLHLLKKLYITATIKPKMHYMVHYPSQIERHGPLIHSWTMHHEGKLSPIKRASRRGNYKNIVQTVVKHYQKWLSYYLHCAEHLLYVEPELSRTHSQTPEFVSGHLISALRKVDPQISKDCTIYHHKWLKIQSTHYKLSSYVLLHRDDFSPLFGKIIDILCVRSKGIFFQVEEYSATTFSSHYNSFVITPSNNYKCIDAHALQHDYHSLLARRSFDSSDGNLYITMPFIF